MAERDNERFEIVGWEGEGYYLYRYVDGKSMNDYFAPTIQGAQETAFLEWRLRESVWRSPDAEEPWFER